MRWPARATTPVGASERQAVSRAARRIGGQGRLLVLVDEATGEIRHDWLAALADDVARLQQDGCEVVLVSSGAIRLGRTHLKLPAGPLSSRRSRPPPPPARSRLAHA